MPRPKKAGFITSNLGSGDSHYWITQLSRRDHWFRRSSPQVNGRTKSKAGTADVIAIKPLLICLAAFPPALGERASVKLAFISGCHKADTAQIRQARAVLVVSRFASFPNSQQISWAVPTPSQLLPIDNPHQALAQHPSCSHIESHPTLHHEPRHRSSPLFLESLASQRPPLLGHHCVPWPFAH